jgi:hypothetical protein
VSKLFAIADSMRIGATLLDMLTTEYLLLKVGKPRSVLVQRCSARNSA